jgi:uncharacterized caspase-like protein
MTFMVDSMMAQTKRALVVGISEYEKINDNAWGAIHGANDADLIISVLKKQGFKSTKISDKAATAKRIRKSLSDLVASCKSADIIYLHFSGHGQPFEDVDGDEEDGWDESIVPYDAQMAYKKKTYEGQNHITDDELHNYLKQIRKAVGSKGYVCVVIDACHAGGASRGEDEIDEDEEQYVRGTKKGFSPTGKEFRPRINAKGAFRIPQESGLANIMILEACRSYQSNYEIKEDGKYYGPLTYYISQVLAKRKLSCSIDWISEVNSMMKADKRLTRQNMVYETSIQ